MSTKEKAVAVVLAGGAALCMLTLIAYSQFAGDGVQPRPARSPERAAVPPGAAKAPAPLLGEKAPAPLGKEVPTALVTAPTRLALETYELTPATFFSWRDYLAGDPKDRLWARIAWRTNLWDGVIDAHEEGKPILLEIHGGNALGRC